MLFKRILQTSGRNGMEEYLALTNLWIDGKECDPKWDGAVRDWARTQKPCERLLKQSIRNASRF